MNSTFTSIAASRLGASVLRDPACWSWMLIIGLLVASFVGWAQAIDAAILLMRGIAVMRAGAET